MTDEIPKSIRVDKVYFKHVVDVIYSVFISMCHNVSALYNSLKKIIKKQGKLGSFR